AGGRSGVVSRQQQGGAVGDDLGDRFGQPAPLGVGRLGGGQCGQIGQQVLRGGPLDRVLGQTGGDRGDQGRGQVGQVRFGVHDPVDHRVQGAFAEGAAAGGGEGEDAAEGEHVRGRADLFGAGLFGGHVCGGAQHGGGP